MATLHTMSSGSLYAPSSFLKKIFWLYLARILFQENDKRQAFHTQDSRGVFLIGTAYFLYQENIPNNQSLTACLNTFPLPRKSIKELFFYCMHSNTFSTKKSYKTFMCVLQESEQDTYLILGSTCITNKLTHPYQEQLLYLCI